MKYWRIAAVYLGALMISACTPPPVERTEPEPPPPPPPTPVPTPHPAASAQERAVQLYPDLAVKDSLFNRTFLELVENYKTTNPRILTLVDWPLTVAHQTGSMLGVHPSSGVRPETPPPPAPPAVVYVTPKLGSSLDKGAYNGMRGVAKTPMIRYVP